MIDIAFVIIMAMFIYYGAKRGFARSIIGLLSTVVSIIMGMLLMQPVATVLNSGSLGTSIETATMNWIENRQNTQTQVPDFLLSGVSETASAAFSELVINALSFMIVIILVKVITGILANVIATVFKLPVLKQANALLGGVLGGLCGVVICYVIVGITAALVPISGAGAFAAMLDNSVLLSGWYNNNILTNSFMNF